MSSSFLQDSFHDNLEELRRTDNILVALQQMLSCPRRGLCLMHEWFRRYGTAGVGCRCNERFMEHVMTDDIDPDEDL